MPGRSYGISIARRLNLPEEVVARAEERIPQGERDMAALIERLERQEKELVAREREATAMLDDARERIAAVIRRENNVRERERTVEKQSRQEARKYVLEARAEIERTIAELKRKGAQRGRRRSTSWGATRVAARRSSRRSRRTCSIASTHEERAVERKRGRVPPAERGTVTVNDAVEVGTLGGKVGRVLDLRGKDAVVAVGSLKLTVPLADAAAAPRRRRRRR